MKNRKKIIWGGFLIFLSLYMLADSFYGIQGPSIFRLGLSFFIVLHAITRFIDRSFVEAFLCVGILGYINFNYLGFTSGSPWVLIGASLLMGLGFQVLFKKKRKSYNFTFNDKDVKFTREFDDNIVDVEVDIEDHFEEEAFSSKTGQTNAEDFIRIESNFSDQKRYVRSDNFTRGDLESNFGNLEVYFQSTTFNPSGAIINVDSNFGNVTLYLPKTVNVDNHLKAALGAITGDSSFHGANYPTVRLEGSANFGKISVRYL